MPKVSVIIPAYNAMAYLPETVESLLRQTFTDFEVVIVNNGSTDRIVEWVSQIVDPRVSLISQVNQGLPGGLNTGIAHTQGEYIAFLEADDLWEPTKLEKQVRCLDDNPAVGLVYTWTLLVDEKAKSTGRVFASHAEGNVWKQLAKHNIIGCGSTAMVRRCCFETVGLFDRSLCCAPDWDMWFRIASHYQFAVLKEALVCYRQHSNNMSKNWQAMSQDFSVVIEKAFYSVPTDLLYLKEQSYGFAYFCIAWKCLQSSDRNYSKAMQFLQQALVHHPQLRYSWEYIRLNLSIKLVQSLGIKGYDKVLRLFHALRRWKTSMAQ